MAELSSDLKNSFEENSTVNTCFSTAQHATEHTASCNSDDTKLSDKSRSVPASVEAKSGDYVGVAYSHVGRQRDDSWTN